jgi:hypothetical protein
MRFSKATSCRKANVQENYIEAHSQQEARFHSWLLDLQNNDILRPEKIEGRVPPKFVDHKRDAFHSIFGRQVRNQNQPVKRCVECASLAVSGQVALESRLTGSRVNLFGRVLTLGHTLRRILVMADARRNHG